MNYPYIKITIEEFNKPLDENSRYPDRTELATQIINKDWFTEHEMLRRIMAVIYGLEPPMKPDLNAIRKAMQGGE